MSSREKISSISIIIPVYNEEKSIRSCLEKIINQVDIDIPFEVIVADGMSTDNTRAIIQEICRNNHRIKLIDNPEKIVSSGLNRAIKMSRGDIIIRIDAHTEIAPDYVKRCIELLEKADADNVGGRMCAIGRTPFGHAVAIATSTPFGIGGSRFHYSDKEEEVDTVYLGAWRRDIFQKYGLFDEELVRDQDDEFNYRTRAMGGKILLSPKIRSEYTVRSSPGSLWRQYYQYGYWKVRVLQKHPRQMRPHQFVPPLFVLALIVSLFLAVVPGVRWMALVVPGLYLLANLGASLLTASKRGWRYFPLLPVVFAILHLSYGLGFLTGLIRFAHRWKDRRGKVPRWAEGG